MTFGYRSVLSNHYFLILWINQIIQQLSFGILNFSLVVLVVRLTGSNLATALVVAAITLPALLFGMIAGVVADSIDRRTIIKAANLAMAVCVFLLTSAEGKVGLILLLAFLISLVNQFFIPAEQASIPMVVKRGQLILANSLFAMTFFAGQILGLSLAGPLILVLGFRRVFTLVTLGFGLAYLLVWFLPKLLPGGAKFGIWTFEQVILRVTSGLRFVIRRERVKWGIASIVLVEAMLAILVVLSPNFVNDVLGVAPESIGYLLIPPAGLGFVGTAYLIGKFGQDIRRERLAAIGILGEGFAVIFVGLIPEIAPLFPAGSATLLLAVAGFFIGSLAVAVTIPARTLLQEEVSRGMLGRVFAVLTILTVLSASLPILILAVLADLFGTQLIMGLVGILVFLAGIVFVQKERLRAWVRSTA